MRAPTLNQNPMRLRRQCELGPFFSVVIPIYNKELYLAGAIESVLLQTWEDFELIVVCDPSTDNSIAEVAKFSDPRIKVFYRDQAGPGGYAARNLGIRKARGHWVAFLDADDTWYPGYLENAAKKIRQNPCIGVYSCARRVVQYGRVHNDTFSQLIGDADCVFDLRQYLYYSIHHEKPFCTNTTVVKSSLLGGRCLFPEGEAKRSGDVVLWVYLVAQSGSFYFSSFLGSFINKDTIGVSKTATPSMKLPVRMVNELIDGLDNDEAKLLKRYANRLIKTAFLEQKRKKNSVECRLLVSFYWSADPVYCMKWFLVCSLPRPLLGVLDMFRFRF